MLLNNGLVSQIKILALLALMISIGCASIQRPQGGPRDRTPPVLLKATPANKTRNFSAKQIRLDFDEYFKLASPYSEIIVSPAFEKQPEYKTHQKSLIIDFKDTLQKNTTYVFNFGKAIADIHEGNILKNFTYVFSTGNQIDSLSISGHVTNSLTATSEKDITVMIFPASKDTALFGKKKPTLFTTTDSTGNFSLNNLHEGEYTIYALKEASPDRIYNNEAELIAFLKKPVLVKGDVSNIQLDLFKQEPDKFRVLNKRFDPDGKILMQFNKPLTNPSIKINYPPALDAQKIVDINATRDTALIFMRSMDFDSLSVIINDNNKPIDTVYVKKGRKEEFKRTVGMQYNINVDNHLRPNTDLQLTASQPIETVDMSKIKLLEDSIPVTGLTLIKNPENPRKFTIKHRWRQNTRYELAFAEEALTDIYNDKNKEFNKRFTIDKPENYGNLTLKVTVPDTSKNYIIQLLDGKNNIIQTNVISKNTSVNYKNIFTGKYQIKVIYDDNRNGKADSGNVKEKVYPEKAWYMANPITLRPNWDMEENLEIPKENTNP